MESAQFLTTASNSTIRKPKISHNMEISQLSPKPNALDPSDLSRSSSAPSMSPKSSCDLNRVHEELEKLNIATDVINKLELQLDEARSAFREIQSSWSHRLELLGKKLGGCIEKSRPYYEARLKVLEAQQEAQRAALRFERANSMHGVAKQQVALTQESLNRPSGSTKSVDPACLEVLNHHVQRVNDAELERLRSEQEHHDISRRVSDATSLANGLEQELKRNIRKSKAYFDARVEFNKVLEKQKELIGKLEIEIKQKKVDYNTALRNLESISERIHEQRQTSGSRDCVPFDEPHDFTAQRSLEQKQDDDEASAPPSDPEDCRTVPVKNCGEVTEFEKVTNCAFSNPNEFHSAKTEDSSDKHSSVSVRISSTLTSGVILLAQELSLYDWLEEDTRRSAFSLPPPPSNQYEDFYDVRYQTVPEGVKPNPSPPETPSALVIEICQSVDNSAFNQSQNSAEIDCSSAHCRSKCKNLIGGATSGNYASVQSANDASVYDRAHYGHSTPNTLTGKFSSFPLVNDGSDIKSAEISSNQNLASNAVSRLTTVVAISDCSDDKSDASSVASIADGRPITNEYLVGVFKNGESLISEINNVTD